MIGLHICQATELPVLAGIYTFSLFLRVFAASGSQSGGLLCLHV